LDALPIISVLVLVFAMILVNELVKVKKDVRKLSRLTRILRQDLEQLNNNNKKNKNDI